MKYLLSPQDLAAYDLVPELLDAGVASLKIEGRLKTPEYVANITQHYRRAIDEALAGRAANFSQREVEEMELSFSRGFSHGWLHGCDHKALVQGRSSTKRGIFLGEVQGVRQGVVLVKLVSHVKRGDGVVFDAGEQEKGEQGGRVYDVRRKGVAQLDGASSGIVELAFGRGDLHLAAIRPGQRLWKTDDPQLTQRLRGTFRGVRAERRVPLDLFIEIDIDRGIVVHARAESGATCEVVSGEPFTKAEKHPVEETVLREQFGRLGKSVFTLRELKVNVAGDPMVPLSVLGRLRRQMLEQLERAKIGPRHRVLSDAPVLPVLRERCRDDAEDVARPSLSVLCRHLHQLDAAFSSGVRRIYADFHDIREYAKAVERARSVGATIFLATPRIQKPSELGIFRFLLRHRPDGILVRNLGGLQFFSERDLPWIADYSINVANELAARYVRDRGAQRITPSFDLNREQVEALLRSAPPSWFEFVVHQHMPMFHMEHCVFCAVLSPGTNKTNCGRPCDRHQVALRDRIGVDHPLHADVGCRNTLFNAVPQSAAEVVPHLIQVGVRSFRIELLDDTAMQASKILATYQALLAGRRTGREVWVELHAANRVGVTRGTLEERRNPLALL